MALPVAQAEVRLSGEAREAANWFTLGVCWRNGRFLDAQDYPSKIPDFGLFRVQQSRTTIYDKKRLLL
jgi:hypothetical protein